MWSLALGLPTLMLAAIPLLPLLQDRDSWAMFAYPAVVSTWGVMGAVVVDRPAEQRRWLLLWVVGRRPRGQPGGPVMELHQRSPRRGHVAWDDVRCLAELALLADAGPRLIVPPLLFPDGRLMSRRWLVVLVFGVASAVGLALGAIIRPGLLEMTTS